MWLQVKPLFVKPSTFGIVLGVVFFAVSLSPSMIPRPVLMQGLLSGSAFSLGYGLSALIVALREYMEIPEPSIKWRQRLNSFALWVALLGCMASVFYSSVWQGRLYQVMGLAPQDDGRWFIMVLIALALVFMIIIVSRVIQQAFRLIRQKLNKYIPRPVANVLSITAVVFLVMTLSNQFVIRNIVTSMDEVYAAADKLTDEGIQQPSDPLQSGSEVSLIKWDNLGRTGKNFVVTGPSRQDIAEHFESQRVKAPLRVYVGLRSAETVEQRAQLALQELIRVGGFERKKLIVATPTGTGWHDASGVDPVEFLHRGDTAMVTMQYSYLPSWLTLLLDPMRARISARALLHEVYSYWTTLPKDKRPDLYLYGLSLGALGAETSINMGSLLRDPIQGGVFAGAPFTSTFLHRLMSYRNPGSPQWQPLIEDGSFVRFTAQQNALNLPGADWGKVRLVYIQYASDPMVFFTPDLYWREPDWIKLERGPDVSPDLQWFPVITFLQVLFDLPMADRVPKGVAHNYAASSYIDAWVAVTQPEDWTEADTHALKQRFAGR